MLKRLTALLWLSASARQCLRRVPNQPMRDDFMKRRSWGQHSSLGLVGLHLAPFCHNRYTTTTTTTTRYKRFRKFISFTSIGLAAYSHIRNISKVVIEAAILVEVKLLSMTGHLDYSVKKVPRKNRHNCCYRLCCVWPSQVAHSVSLFILGLVLLILVGALANFFLLTAWLESLAAPYIAIIYLQLVL